MALQRAAGVDLIKLYLTPASSSPTPMQAYFGREEVEVAVEEAHRGGRPVAVHAHGGQAASDAIQAGVDSLEHGLRLTPVQLEAMAARGTWLVLTQTIRLWDADESKLSAPLREARAATRHIPIAARQAGVRVAVGTDGAHGLLYFELVCLVEAGFAPMEALLAGTKHAAEAIGLGSRTGTLQVGKWADIIAVAADPLANMGALRDVVFIMKGGQVLRKPG